MREILFKAKRIDNGEWVEGFYWAKLNPQVENKSFNNHFIHDGFVFDDKIEVDPQTLSQYTGLKDTNGVKIFEGDVILAGTPHTEKVVVFEDGRFGTKCSNGFYTLNGWLKGGRSVEIIGNIHTEKK